jgi:hypothetical protein
MLLQLCQSRWDSGSLGDNCYTTLFSQSQTFAVKEIIVEGESDCCERLQGWHESRRLQSFVWKKREGISSEEVDLR